MAFVKLDCGMLDSTLWIDRCARELFITALLMAEPYELKEPAQQIEVRTLSNADFFAPPGWYGFVAAAGTGIIHRCGMDQESGFKALERLGEPENESRTPAHGGRRMIRINGGYLILNYDLYRNKDHTAAERAKRYREKKAASRVTPRSSRVSNRSVTQAEAYGTANAVPAEAEADSTSALADVGANGSHPASGSKPSNVEWLAELSADRTYAGIDVAREHGKMLRWCHEHKKEATRRRFINWLNRADRTTEISAKPQRKWKEV